MKFLDDELQPAPYYEDRHKYIGKIAILDGIVDITDPGYENDTWCARFGYKIKPGIYKCYIDMVNFVSKVICETEDCFDLLKGYKEGDIAIMDDNRIVTLTIIHESIDKDTLLKFDIIDDNIGVDAGMCGFYNHKPNFSDEEKWTNFWQNLTEYKHRVCDCKHANGVTVSSGFGDGVYCLAEAKNENGETIALRLDFNDDAPFEDSYADEYEN